MEKRRRAAAGPFRVQESAPAAPCPAAEIHSPEAHQGQRKRLEAGRPSRGGRYFTIIYQ